MLPPMESRNLSVGLAKRTIKNLDFIKNAPRDADVHLVTQVINSLLGLLVFPYEKENRLGAELAMVEFIDPSSLASIYETITQHLPVPSLELVKFGGCKNLKDFLRRIRNAISHNRLEFTGANPDSRILREVRVSLSDRKQGYAIDWEINMSAEDLESLSRFVADRVISLAS